MLWEEDHSEEPKGWYKSVVLKYNSKGDAELLYLIGTSEHLNLFTAKWKFARKSSKKYYSIDSPPPDFIPVCHQRINSRKMVKSSEHKIKCFADDLTLISSDKEDHRNALSRSDLYASDLDLAIRADKCYILSLKGLKQDKNFSVALVSGKITPISKAGTKFLGKYIAYTPKPTTTLCNNSISSKFKVAMEKIDPKHIRGEFKVWIYHHYLAPSLPGTIIPLFLGSESNQHY